MVNAHGTSLQQTTVTLIFSLLTTGVTDSTTRIHILQLLKHMRA